jgi:hypothetical protein
VSRPGGKDNVKTPLLSVSAPIINNESQIVDDAFGILANQFSRAFENPEEDQRVTTDIIPNDTTEEQQESVDVASQTVKRQLPITYKSTLPYVESEIECGASGECLDACLKHFYPKKEFPKDSKTVDYVLMKYVALSKTRKKMIFSYYGKTTNANRVIYVVDNNDFSHARVVILQDELKKKIVNRPLEILFRKDRQSHKWCIINPINEKRTTDGVKKEKEIKKPAIKTAEVEKPKVGLTAEQVNANQAQLLEICTLKKQVADLTATLLNMQAHWRPVADQAPAKIDDDLTDVINKDSLEVSPEAAEVEISIPEKDNMVIHRSDIQEEYLFSRREVLKPGLYKGVAVSTNLLRYIWMIFVNFLCRIFCFCCFPFRVAKGAQFNKLLLIGTPYIVANKDLRPDIYDNVKLKHQTKLIALEMHSVMDASRIKINWCELILSIFLTISIGVTLLCLVFIIHLWVLLLIPSFVIPTLFCLSAFSKTQKVKIKYGVADWEILTQCKIDLNTNIKLLENVNHDFSKTRQYASQLYKKLGGTTNIDRNRFNVVDMTVETIDVLIQDAALQYMQRHQGIDYGY